MAADSDITKLQEQAFAESLNQSVVYMFHLDHADNPGSGSGVLVSLRGYTYVVSARHNFALEKRSDLESIVRVWNETKFHVREAPLKFHEPLRVPTYSETQQGTARGPLIDPGFDLIAVRLDPEQMLPPGNHAVKLEHRAYMGTVAPGAVLTTLGLPLGGAQKSQSGPRLVPYKFSATFDPEVPKPSISSEYKSGDYLLYPYTGNVGARGYSGAPVWISESENMGLWKANPLIVGITLKLFPTSNLILAVRIKHVIALLQEDILPNVSAPVRVG